MNDKRSNTADNSATGKPFTKGDKRINRKGRPKTFETLRAEALKIAGEIVTDKNGEPVASRIHAIMLDWATSKDVRKQQLFIEYAYGKVPDKTEVSGANGGPVKHEIFGAYDVDLSDKSDAEITEYGKQLAKLWTD